MLIIKGMYKPKVVGFPSIHLLNKLENKNNIYFLQYKNSLPPIWANYRLE